MAQNRNDDPFSDGSKRPPPEGSAPRRSGILGLGTVLRRTRRFGADASSAAVEAVSGAIRATDEITGETTGFVRDAVIGVVESTGRVARIGRPVVKDVVSAAVRSSTELGGSMPEASQRAVEGAIVGAAQIGVQSEDVSAQASAGVVEAVRELGGEFQDVVAPAIHGVVIGVIATSGDMFQSTRDTAAALLTSGAQSGEDVTLVARTIVREAIRASRTYGVTSTDAVMGAAQGAVEAAYKVNTETGDAVRLEIMAVVDAPISTLTPNIRDSITEALADLSDQLRDRPQSWRGVALWRAIKTILAVNGIDTGAALAYYMLLALFPLVALVIVGLSTFMDSSVIRSTMAEVVVFYFPSSKDFLEEAIDHLFEARLFASLIAIAAMLFGAQGLFMAANRGVNRVFDCEPRRIIDVTLSTFAIVVLGVWLFLTSVGLTFVLQISLGVLEDLPTIGVPLDRFLFIVAQVASILTPFAIAAVVFIIVYRYLPNREVRWSDATFGGLVTVILFEMAKYFFFWFANLASQRSLLYGSVSSVILLLVWSHVAGMIFLYGAALTKEASELRPHGSISLRRIPQEDVEDREARRYADIARGRAAVQRGRWSRRYE